MRTKRKKQPENGQSKRMNAGGRSPQPLTPEEIRKRRKMLVYPLLFLVFGVAMWLIFAPSDEGESLPDGFKRGSAHAGGKELPSDKRAAYEQQGFRAQAAGEDEQPCRTWRWRRMIRTGRPWKMCSRPKKLHHRAGRPSAPRQMPTGTSTGRLAASTSSRSGGRPENAGTGVAHTGTGTPGRKRNARQRKPPTSSSA